MSISRRLALKPATLLSLALGAMGVLTSPAGHTADKLKVGFLTTLSGPGAALGIDIRDGFQLGLSLAGDKFGGLPVELTVLDDQQNPDAGRQAAERLLKKEQVHVMTGMVFSNVMLPIMPAILDSGTFYLSTNSGPEIYAGEKCHPNFFAVAWQNEDIPAAMGKHASDKGYNKVALIAPNYPGGRESLNGFKRLYKGQIVEEIYTKLGQLDYASELAQLRAAKADAVFFFLPGGMGINFIKQYVSSGLSRDSVLLAPGFSGDEDTIKGTGKSILGMYNTSQWGFDMDNAANTRFVSEFRQRYKRTPSMYAAQAYDTALLLDSAVRDVKGKIEDKDALRRALAAANFKSVRGNFRFNRNHYPIQNYYLRLVHEGKDGTIQNRIVGAPILSNYEDPFAAACKMK